MIVDAGRLPITGKKSKPHDYQQNVQKMKDLAKTCVSTGKQIEDFRKEKEEKQNSQLFKKPQWDTRTLEPSIENRPCKQQELN